MRAAFSKKGWVMISMKNDKIIASWDKIEPSDCANNRMLSAIIEMNHSTQKGKDMERIMRKTITSKKMVASIAACLVAVVLVTGFLGGHVGWFKGTNSIENPANNTIILPPSRIGTTTLHASFGPRYTFDTAYSEADAVARVVVGNWLGEDSELQKSYYEASVQECFKGDLPEKITLLQDGCSSGTLKQYPLFTSGNELLVFINKASVTDYVSPYWIIGSFTTLLDVSYDKIGTRYYVDRYGILGETIGISTNYATDKTVFEEVYSRTAETDEIVKEMHYDYPYIFSEEDMILYLESNGK